MNEHAGYAVERGGKWWAMLRFPKDGKPKPVLGKCGAPIRFDTELEALKTVNKHLVGYMNGPEYRRDGETIQMSKADAHFKLKPYVKAKGSQKRTVVERKDSKGKEISVERAV